MLHDQRVNLHFPMIFLWSWFSYTSAEAPDLGGTEVGELGLRPGRHPRRRTETMQDAELQRLGWCLDGLPCTSAKEQKEGVGLNICIYIYLFIYIYIYTYIYIYISYFTYSEFYVSHIICLI